MVERVIILTSMRKEIQNKIICDNICYIISDILLVAFLEKVYLLHERLSAFCKIPKKDDCKNCHKNLWTGIKL
jgi:hypothetical protein